MEPSDQELVSRAQQGDESAFEALVHRYDRQVLSIAASFTRDPEDSKDVYQEVFLRVYRSLVGFRFESEFSTWLYRIVVNVCLTLQARNKSRGSSADGGFESHSLDSGRRDYPSPDGLSPERQAQHSEISRHIEEALKTLSPQQRLVFMMKHYQGFKFREIAEMMQCAEGTVKRYHFTAIDKLRRRLKHFYQ